MLWVSKVDTPRYVGYLGYPNRSTDLCGSPDIRYIGRMAKPIVKGVPQVNVKLDDKILAALVALCDRQIGSCIEPG